MNSDDNIQIIVESQLFGTINYIKTLFQFSHVKIEQWDYYRKMGFRNRCIVAGANGLVHLSVPLEKGRDRQQLMRDVRVNYAGRWQKEQLRTLESCYRRSPFFEHYWPELVPILEKREPYLLDRNQAILAWLQPILGLEARLELTATYEATPAGIIDRRDETMPANYLQLDPGIRYAQVFEERIGFQPNLSVLDLLFCTGPEAAILLSAGG